MDTRAQQFVVSFLSNEGMLKIVPSQEKSYDGVVLGKVNQCFTINIQCRDLDKAYAAKLFIDDQEVVKCKTFRKRGNFFGFRRGNGNYDRFVFKIPISSPDILSNDAESLKKKGKQMGEIRIVFFNASLVWKKAPQVNQDAKKIKNRGPSIEPHYTQVPMGDAKNFASRSLSVGLGKGFQLDMPPLRVANEGPHKGMISDTMANFEEPIDQIVIRYSHVATVMALGILNPFLESSLDYFPAEFVKKNKLILECFYQTLQLQKLTSAQIMSKLEGVYGMKMDDMYPGGIAALIKEMRQRKEKLTRQDIIQAIHGGEFMSFCVAQTEEEQPTSLKDEKKFLGKRPTPGREIPKKPKQP
jgi:hypothetical protein